MMRVEPPLIEKLKRHDVDVADPQLLYYKDFIAFDFESCLEPVEGEAGRKGDKTLIDCIHRPISVGLKSSRDLDSFIYNEDPKALVKEFLKTILMLRMHIVRQLMKEWRPVFKRLNDVYISTYKWMLIAYRDDGNGLSPAEQQIVDLTEEEDAYPNKYNVTTDNYWEHHDFLVSLRKLKKDLLNYIREVPILGYNSAKYDMNLIKSCLFEVLTSDMPDGYRYKMAAGNDPPHPAGDYSEFEVEVFTTDNINVIKQQGGYSSVSVRGVLVFKDMFKFNSPNTI
jgi:hypothetical protein